MWTISLDGMEGALDTTHCEEMRIVKGTWLKAGGGAVVAAARVVAIARWGRKWFGTSNGGVSCFDGETWTTYTTADGLCANLVFAITVDSDDKLWFATAHGVSEFTPDEEPMVSRIYLPAVRR